MGRQMQSIRGWVVTAVVLAGLGSVCQGTQGAGELAQGFVQPAEAARLWRCDPGCPASSPGR